MEKLASVCRRTVRRREMRGGGGRGRGALGRVRGGGTRKPLPSITTSRRDSDASLCSSSRPSSVSLAHVVPTGPPISDRSYQSSALRSVNAYLTSISSVSLRPPLPSARDITRAFDDVLARLGWSVPVGLASALEDDLPSLLTQLGCPVKLSKSALKSPGTPHAWPPLLGALNWLVQLARYSDHCDSSSSSTFAEGNNVLQYHIQSFSLFMDGEDDAVEALDQEQLRQTEEQVAKHVAALESLENEAAQLGRRADALRSGPTPLDAAERERTLLKDDIKKFDVMIESWKEKLTSTEKLLAEKEEVLDTKLKESRRISEENEELRNRVGLQAVNARDAERMKKELQAMERDIAEAEIGRNALEEKSWELDADVDRKQKEMESLVEQANHAIRKLKLGSDFQYVLNAKGSSPSEVLGTNYKTVLKPCLNQLADEMKKSSVAKLEEKIGLQKLFRERSLEVEEKKELLLVLQKKIDEGESQLILLKKDTEEHESMCTAAIEKMMNQVEKRVHELNIMEQEAEKFLNDSELKLQHAISEGEEETQMCAGELVALIDSVSEYKEHMESLICGMQVGLSETAQAVTEVHKAHLSQRLSSLSCASLSGSKRSHFLLES